VRGPTRRTSAVTSRSLSGPTVGHKRWHDDPPAGTINYDGGRSPEIYRGDGEWQRVKG